MPVGSLRGARDEGAIGKRTAARPRAGAPRDRRSSTPPHARAGTSAAAITILTTGLLTDLVGAPVRGVHSHQDRLIRSRSRGAVRLRGARCPTLGVPVLSLRRRSRRAGRRRRRPPTPGLARALAALESSIRVPCIPPLSRPPPPPRSLTRASPHGRPAPAAHRPGRVHHIKVLHDDARDLLGARRRRAGVRRGNAPLASRQGWRLGGRLHEPCAPYGALWPPERRPRAYPRGRWFESTTGARNEGEPPVDERLS